MCEGKRWARLRFLYLSKRLYELGCCSSAQMDGCARGLEAYSALSKTSECIQLFVFKNICILYRCWKLPQSSCAKLIHLYSKQIDRMLACSLDPVHVTALLAPPVELLHLSNWQKLHGPNKHKSSTVCVIERGWHWTD